jgi:citrate synthase
MSDAAGFTPPGATPIELPVRDATEGSSGANISKLLSSTGYVTYDPGFANTASCTSSITYIDGANGVLR